MDAFLNSTLEELRYRLGKVELRSDDAPPCPFHHSAADVVLWDFTPETEWACLKCCQIFVEEDPYGS